jgi:glycosyltransferase involved in cell wall biosynthesis
MKLSILLTSYNQAKYIDQAVDSIINQNISFDYEIIVADDKSTDTTLELISTKLAKTAINYTILESDTNIGISKNYQRGFKACKGEFIAILEGDDYWTDPDRISKHVGFLENHQECIMSFNRFVIFEEQLNKFHYDPKFKNDQINFEYISSQDLASGNKKIGNLSSCVFRNSKLIKWEDRFFEVVIADLFLGIYLGNFGSIAQINNYMSVYRIHKNGLWSGNDSTKNKEELVYLIDKYDSILEYKYKNEFEAFKRKINNSETEKTASYLPSFVLKFIHLLFPAVVIKKIKNLLFKK